MKCLLARPALRGGVVIILAALCASVLGATGSAATQTQGSASSHAAAVAKKPLASTLARQLATRVSKAGSAGARYQALLAVTRALYVRVYSAKGKVLAKGARNVPRDFYLYDVELKAMAGALGRGDMKTLADLSSLLAAFGIKEKGQPVPAELLRQVLVAGVRKAVAKPKQRSSVVLLLLRELGLRQKPAVDLSKDPPASKLRFDALQTFLVLADAVLPIAKSLGVSGGAPVRTLQRANAPCTTQGAIVAGESMPFIKEALDLADHLSGPIKIIGASLWPFHGALLALSVRIESKSPELQQTHYGPAGHTALAGKELRFSVGVRMLDDVGDFLLNCGPLGGVKFPPPGPVQGVTVAWEQAEASLETHGAISYDPADHKTGADGIATLVFKPKDEKIVGFGLEKSKRGVVNGLALYQSAFGNIPGTLAQFLVPKYAGFAWEVSFHKARGFKFKGLKWRAEVYDQVYGTSYSQYELLSAHVCGEDPDVLWQAQIQEDSNWPLFGHYVFSGVVNIGWQPGGYMRSSSTIGGVAKVDFVPGPPPTAKLTMGYEPGYENSGVQLMPQVTEAPVEEDLSCPAND